MPLTPNLDKWELWTAGKAHLRGANVFQRTLPDGSWCSALEQSFFNQLKAAGANYVNLSVPGIYNVKPANPHAPDAPAAHLYQEITYAKERLDTLIGYAGKADLWAVISLRSAPGRSETDLVAEGTTEIVRDLFSPLPAISSKPRQAFQEMWRTLARRYKDTPHVAGYDILVEPHRLETAIHEKGDFDEFRGIWRAIANETVRAIRGVDDKTPILVCLDGYGSMAGLRGWNNLDCVDPGNRIRVVYDVHQYEPYEYTHGSEEFDKEFTMLFQMFVQLDSWQRQYPIVPLVVNEFGVKWGRPSAIDFLKKEFDLIRGWRPLHNSPAANDSTPPGYNYAIWLWDDPDGACYDPQMSIVQNADFFEAVKSDWAKPA